MKYYLVKKYEDSPYGGEFFEIDNINQDEINWSIIALKSSQLGPRQFKDKLLNYFQENAVNICYYSCTTGKEPEFIGIPKEFNPEEFEMFVTLKYL